MAFVTYIVLVGLHMGYTHTFTPEVLGELRWAWVCVWGGVFKLSDFLGIFRPIFLWLFWGCGCLQRWQGLQDWPQVGDLLAYTRVYKRILAYTSVYKRILAYTRVYKRVYTCMYRIGLAI